MKKFLRLFLMLGVIVSSAILFTGCGNDIILVTGVDLYVNEMYVDVNDTIDLSYKVYPSNATNKKVTFWSTDENVASVDANGKITVKDYGEASVVVRSVDGGYEDYCKIITNIDPDSISYTLNDKLTASSGTSYSAVGSMALNQTMKLKIDYFLDGEISDAVTNKNVVFTSSNSNIKIINEKEGIIKAVNNEITEGEKAYCDITATLKIADGELKTTCRIYINEYSSLNNLYLTYKNGNNQVLNQRNGTETIYLTSGGGEVEFYAYITDMSNFVKTDYDMTIVSGNTSLFTVLDFSRTNDGFYHFKLKPSEDEGTGTLYIKSTCSDENGKMINCNVNVTIQAEIKSAKATATNRKSNGYEILVNGEIFSIDLTYFDALDCLGNKIEGAKRDIYFDPISSLVSNYITDYGNNQFKVKSVPTNPNELLSLSGYVYVENVDSSDKIPFVYKFYLRNSLESLMVSKTPKTTEIPSVGISSVTLGVGRSTSVYAYATTYDFNLTEPTEVTAYALDGSLVSVAKSVGDQFVITANDTLQGTTTIIFSATDGVMTINYELTVNIVETPAEIKIYENYDVMTGNYSGEVTDTYNASNSVIRLYLSLEPTSGTQTIENVNAIILSSNYGTITKAPNTNILKTYNYIDIDLSNLVSGGSLTITIYAERIGAYKTITIIKG